MMNELIEQEAGENRKDYLLRVAVVFIGIHGLEGLLIDYDGVTCDGQCLKDDIESALEEEA